MKIKLNRAEHLLWMSPIILGGLIYFISYSDSIMLFIGGDFHLISYTVASLIFTAALAIPFLFHVIVRKINRRNLIISWIHIVLSVTLNAGSLFIFSKNIPNNFNWRYKVSGIELFERWEYNNSISYTIIMIFCFVQLIYIAYALLLVIVHALTGIRSKSNYDSELDTEYYQHDVDEIGASQMIA